MGIATRIDLSRYDLDVNPSLGDDDIVQIGVRLERDMVSVLPDVPGVASYQVCLYDGWQKWV